MVSVVDGLELSTADLCLTIMPLTHIHGIIACLFATLASGGRCLCAPGRDPRAFWQAVSVRPPTWSSCVPTLLQSILDEAPAERPQGLSDLRFLRTSSSSLPKSLYERSRRYFGVPLLEAYGMTEATHQIASNPGRGTPPHAPCRPLLPLRQGRGE